MLLPDWPAVAGVHAACSTRAGGVSAPPYDSLNLGDHVGDDPVLVAENRRRFAGELGARPVFLKQVHGWGVVRLAADTPDGAEADACWTTEPGVACTIMVADCLPVLIANRAGSVVGAAHCGWRGLCGARASGALEALWAAMQPVIGRPDQAIAWLGPCIGPEAFEVGGEVREAFIATDRETASFFRTIAGTGKFLADLPGLARRRLQSIGITALYGNDGGREWSTVADASRFFSHRRDRVSGRFAAAVWLA